MNEILEKIFSFDDITVSSKNSLNLEDDSENNQIV